MAAHSLGDRLSAFGRHPPRLAQVGRNREQAGPLQLAVELRKNALLEPAIAPAV
ncbi:MAG TPA: hypothetical protein VHW01_16340 [Polyangiaceae bacterium]|jgi:hypothetical protein|nr:hypothetical protein [Polyangiaceae bacterium]